MNKLSFLNPKPYLLLILKPVSSLVSGLKSLVRHVIIHIPFFLFLWQLTNCREGQP